MDSPHTPGIDSRSAAGPSLPQRIWGVFTAPRAVFEFLDTTPRLLGALLVLVVVNGLIGVLVTKVAIAARLAHLESMPNADASRTAAMVAVMKIAIPVVSALAIVGYIFIVAALLLFITNVVLGGATTYKRMAAAQAHIWMVTIAAGLVRVPLILSQQDIQVQTSLAAFLPQSDSATFLYQALARFDLFTLWILGLSVVSVAVLGKMPTRKAAGGVVGGWLLLAVVWTPIAVFLARRSG